MDELVQLERELGIGSEDGTTDLDELVAMISPQLNLGFTHEVI
jgi:hypothetical protein